MKKVDDIANLWEEFLYPFGSVNPIEIETEDQAKSVIAQLQIDLNPKEKWNIRNSGIETAIKCLKGSLYYYNGGDLRDLIPQISGTITDLRTIIVRNGCLLISSLAQVLETDFQSQFDQYFPLLLKQIKNTSNAISTSAHLAILKVALHLTTKSFARSIFNLASNPDLRYRQICSEFCYILAEMWPNSIIDTFKSNLDEIISILSKDQDQIIQCFACSAKDFLENPQAKKAKPTTSIQPLSFERKKKTIVSSSSRKSITPISELKGNDPKKLISQLNDIIQRDLWDLISGKEKDIISAIITAISNMKKIDPIKPLMSPLFKHLHDDFQPRILDLLSVSNFDSDIIIDTANAFSMQEIGESFQKPYTITHLKFFAAIFQTCVPFTINERIKPILDILVNDNPSQPETKIIIDAMNEPHNSSTSNETIETVVNKSLKLLTCIGKSPDILDETQEEGSSEDEGKLVTVEMIINNLLQQFNGKPESIYVIERDLIPGLNKLLKTYPDNVIDFITLLKHQNNAINFSPLVPKLLSIHNEKAVLCVSSLITNIKAMASLITLIQKEPNTSTEALKLYAINAPPQKLVPLINMVPDLVHSFLENEDQNLRKNVFSILGIFQKKIPKQFSKRFSEYSETQKRIIILYSRKQF